jgi:hypothetical protein
MDEQFLTNDVMSCGHGINFSRKELNSEIMFSPVFVNSKSLYSGVGRRNRRSKNLLR